MPKWEIHRKWCRKLGISDEVSKAVDKTIDMGFKGHDDRSYTQRVLFFVKASESYRVGGWDGIKAFFLHHTLDYTEYYIKRFAKEMGWPVDEKVIQKMTRWMKNQMITHVKFEKMYGWRNYEIRGDKNSEVINFLLDALEADVFEVETVNDEITIRFSDDVWHVIEEVVIFVEANFWEIVGDLIKEPQ